MEPKHTIRIATSEDAKVITEIRVRTWQYNYKGIVPDDFLDSMDVESEAIKREQWLAEPQPKCVTIVSQDLNGKVVGFSMSGPSRKKLGEYDGEVYAIYVYPEFQGQGFGRDLFLHSLNDLKNNDFNSCLVWTLKENSSVSFYKKMGGVLEKEDIMEIGKPLDIVAFGWKDLRSKNV